MKEQKEKKNKRCFISIIFRTLCARIFIIRRVSIQIESLQKKKKVSEQIYLGRQQSRIIAQYIVASWF